MPGELNDARNAEFELLRVYCRRRYAETGDVRPLMFALATMTGAIAAGVALDGYLPELLTSLGTVMGDNALSAAFPAGHA